MEINTNDWVYRHGPPGIPTDIKIRIVEALMGGYLVGGGEFTDYRTETKLATELKAISKMRDMSIEEGCLAEIERMAMNLQEFFNKEREKDNEEQ